jgi:hypothetical protein
LRNLVLGFVRILLRSVIMMTITFVILMSVVTREFPPNIHRVTQAYQHLKDYQQAPLGVPELQATNTEEENELQNLTDLYEKRAQFGRALLDPALSSNKLHLSGSPLLHSTCLSEREASQGEIEILKARLLTCQDELARLKSNGPE